MVDRQNLSPYGGGSSYNSYTSWSTVDHSFFKCVRLTVEERRYKEFYKLHFVISYFGKILGGKLDSDPS